MTICITRIDFHNAMKTTLHTIHVPNWFERVVLRRQKRHIIYQGHKHSWFVVGVPLPLSARSERKLRNISPNQQQQFGKIEIALKKQAKQRNVKTLKFK